MPKRSREQKRRIVGFFIGFLIALAAGAVPASSVHWLNDSSTILYIGLVMAWALSVRRRITQPVVCRLLMTAAYLMVFLFVSRTLRYTFFSGSAFADRCARYLYYLPLTAVPLIGFMAALCIGKGDADRPLRTARELWLAELVLCLGVFTNGLHGRLMTFLTFDGEAHAVSYGWLYYVIVGWSFLAALAGLVVLLRRCRLSAVRRLWYVPVLPAAFGFGLLLWYYALGGRSPTLFGVKLYKMQEVFCFIFISLWESCIQIGLIPSNSNYEEIFRSSHWNAVITDRHGGVVYHSAGAALPTAEQLAAARERPQFIDGDHILYAHRIRGGTSYWIEDISAVNALNRELEETIEYLEEENSLLAEENNIRSQRTAYETQNKLYDSIAPVVQPQLTEVRRLLAEGGTDEGVFRDRLLRGMMLCAYVKRRVNLALIADDTPALTARELELAIRETLEYVELCGVLSGMETDGADRPLPSRQLIAAYDFFEAVLEAAMPGAGAVLVNVQTRDGFRLDVTTETPRARIAADWRRRPLARLDGTVNVIEDESAVHFRLCFGKEVGGK